MRAKKLLAAVAIATLAAAGCANGETNATAGAGGTKEIVLGLQTAITGGSASSFGQPTIEAAKARIAKANATNEVPGVRFKLETADEASSAAGGLSATQNLVERKKVSAVLAAGADFYGAYRYAVQKGIPVFGIGNDGPQWSDPANKNLFPYMGAPDASFPEYTGLGEYFKAKGVTRFCMVSHDKASSSKPGRVIIAGMERVGIEVAYQNFTIPLGGTDFSAAAIGVKDSKCDGIGTLMAMSSNIALFEALKNVDIQGSHFKTSFIAGAYGQELLDDPTARQAAQGYGAAATFQPASVESTGTKEMAAALKEYAGWDKPYPKSAHQWGWFTADLAIAAFKKAGPEATSEQVVAAVASMQDYDANGLSCPVDFSKRGAYIPPFAGNCLWIAKVAGTGYESDADPIKLTIIPGTGQAAS